MNVFEKVTESPEALASLLRAIPAIETPWDDAFTGSIAPRARRRIATTAAARSGIARYGGSASRRRRQRNERRFFPHLRGVRARRYGAVGERHYLLSVLCSRQMQGARRRRETL